MRRSWLYSVAASLAAAALTLSGPAAVAQAPGRAPVGAAKVDLTGVWIGFREPGSPYRNTPTPSPVPFTPEGEKMSKFWEDPANNLGQKCLPPGGPWGVMNAGTYFPTEIIQKDKQVTIINEYQNQTRRVYLDGRGHPPDLESSWYGHSIGKWEGDTLVIDTVGVRHGVLNGSGATVNVLATDKDPRLPFSDKLHMVERLRLLEGGRILESDTILTDPKIYTRPLRMKKYWKRADDLDMLEYICAENLRPELEGAPPAAGSR